MKAFVIIGAEDQPSEAVESLEKILGKGLTKVKTIYVGDMRLYVFSRPFWGRVEDVLKRVLNCKN